MQTEFIMYHYVRDLKNSDYPKIKGLDVKAFENQLNFLSKNYNIISIEEFYTGNYKSKKKSCVLTFDDGYKDHYDFVFDKLIKYNVKGAFFTPVDVIDSNKVLDVNKIHLILAKSNEDLIFSRLKYHFEKCNSKNNFDYYVKKVDTSHRYDSEKTVLIKRLLQTVLDFDTRTLICDLLVQDFLSKSEKELSIELYLNRTQINEMIENGMHFGSHGKSHYWFDSLNIKDQEFEIKESIKFLNSIYNRKYLLTICYPYGNYNKDTLKLIKKYKFKLGLTTMPSVFDRNKDNIYLIPRLDTNDYPQNNEYYK